jgi:hypothetical protein
MDTDLVTIKKTKNLFHFNKLVTFDTENLRYEKNISITENKKLIELQKMYGGCLYDGKDYYWVKNKDDLKDLLLNLLNKYNKIDVFAHNLDHDLRSSKILIDIFNDNFLGMQRKLFLYDNIKAIVFQNKKQELRFIDSYNYFKTSLKELGQMFNINKYANEEYKYSPDEWNKYLKENYEELVKDDVYLLYKVIESFISFNFDYGYSIASTAFSTWKNKFLDWKIDYDKQFDSIMFDFYRGANVYVYKFGHFDFIYYYDINSLYPSIMKKFKLSYKFHRMLKQYEFDDLYNMIEKNDYNYIVNVDYWKSSTSVRNPVLTKYKNYLIMLNENKNQWISGLEYKYLIDNDYNVVVNDCQEWYNAPLFKKYVDYFYNKRMNEKTEYGKQFYKMMLNSVYGKTGQKKCGYTLIRNEDIKKEMDLPFYHFYSELKNKHYQKIIYNDKHISIYPNFISIKNEDEFKYAPMIAAEITSFARLTNFDWQLKYGFENIINTDTDSFFSLIEFDKSDIGSEIGKVKLEMAGSVDLFTQKDYIFVNKINTGKHKIGDVITTHKGIPQVHNQISSNAFQFNNFTTFKNKYSLNNIYVENIIKTEKRIPYKMNYQKNRIWNNIEEFDSYLIERQKSIISNYIK